MKTSEFHDLIRRTMGRRADPKDIETVLTVLRFGLSLSYEGGYQYLLKVMPDYSREQYEDDCYRVDSEGSMT